MKKETLKKYAEIKKQIKELTGEAKKLEPEVLTEVKTAMEELGMPNVKTNIGTFTIQKRETWKHSEDYLNKEKELKEKIKKEAEKDIAEGKATKEEKETLSFRSK